MLAPLVPFTATQNIYVARFRFDLQNTGAMSLYALENDLIRQRFSDPRIHFVLNCASGGCPVLRPELMKLIHAGFSVLKLSAPALLRGKKKQESKQPQGGFLQPAPFLAQSARIESE